MSEEDPGRRWILVACHCVLWMMAGALLAAPVSQRLRVDNFGYRPADAKVAIATQNPGASVELRNAADQVIATIPTDLGSITFKGTDGPGSGDTVWWIDFSAFATPGAYRIYSSSLAAQSYDFAIRDDVYDAVTLTALRTFYLQRCNTPKLAAHAGDWADPATCHGGDAATAPAAGHVDRGLLDLRGGWHDAGDYNKYVWGAVSSAILHLLRAYEDNPGVFADGDLDIPESGNGVPDLLDEVKWELDWLLRMQLADGSVLYQMHVPNFESNAPPSADGTARFYQNPTLESGAVFAGTLALASRVYAAAGMTAYAATLKQEAVQTWGWLLGQGASKEKVWAAAEVFRADPTQTSARAYVDAFYPSNWAGRFFDVAHYDTHAAVTYAQTPGATAAVVAAMRQNISSQVDYIFANDDLYRNGMPDWSYYWGSNAIRANYGLFLLAAAKLGSTGSRTAADCARHAQDFLHFFHGQNPVGMVYLTNMAALGGEHSSFQLYHAWFGDSTRSFSRNTFIGKPTSIVEPDYPYFKGIDNHGIGDDKVSLLGPPPGIVVGGPNRNYSGDAFPPAGAGTYNRFYRDWSDQTVWTARTWEITENSIGYQGPYVALGAYFTRRGPPPGCQTGADCDDGVFCNGAESCSGGSCQPGGDPCPGESCDETGDFCFVDPCDGDGACDPGETCNSCPDECDAGGGGGCGDGVCSPSLGEDCLSCATDCAGRQGGKQNQRFCCGDGAGINPVGCGDSRCTAGALECGAPPAPWCCGDGTCGGAETPAFCSVDCGTGPVCGDGVCAAGESCTTCLADCPGKTSGPANKRYCCGNGVAEPPEGNGAICDGRF